MDVGQQTVVADDSEDAVERTVATSTVACPVPRRKTSLMPLTHHVVVKWSNITCRFADEAITTAQHLQYAGTR